MSSTPLQGFTPLLACHGSVETALCEVEACIVCSIVGLVALETFLGHALFAR